MKSHPRIKRFFIGLALVIVLLTAGFAITLSLIHTAGATAAEVQRTYPGDDILTHPVVAWTHAVTIRAAPEKVWPWIIQIGDTRGGFYSYTYVENLIAQKDLYKNADQIHPEWQNPSVGQGIIFDMLAIQKVEAGRYMLATDNVPDLGWTWLWWLEPQANGNTRLIIRMRIQADTPMPQVLMSLVDLGGYVMEKGMIDGIKTRAEGFIPPAYTQVGGIVVWVLTLLVGLACAGLFIFLDQWKPPLVVALCSLTALFVFTFLQPELWLRTFIAILLLVGMEYSYRNARLPQEH